MTNSEIIFQNRVFLMEQGVIKGIEGTSLMWKDEDGEREILMPEEIRTFDDWKQSGYMVQKGEHAVAKFQIWIPKKGKKKDEEQEEQEEEKRAGFYKKVAFFFTADQVKPIEEKGDGHGKKKK